jgi:ribosome maturation protein Sdo1
MYKWKAKIGNLILEENKGASFGSINQDKLEEFSVMDGATATAEIAKINLKNGKIEIFAKVYQEAGATKSRKLIWIKRNVANFKTATYLIGYYVGREKICYAISDKGVIKQ